MVVGRSLPSSGGLPKEMEMYRKLQFIGNFKVIQCFGKLVALHFQWLEFYIKIHGVDVFFLPKMLGKFYCFLKLWLEFQLELSGHPEIFSMYCHVYNRLVS